MAACLFSPLAPCKLLCLVLGRVRKREQFLAAVMLVVSWQNFKADFLLEVFFPGFSDIPH